MLKPKDIERAQRWFDRHDAAAAYFCRLIPGIRTIISVPAGIQKMNLGYFLFLSVCGTLIWVGLLTYLGSIPGQHYDKVGAYLDPVSYAVFGFLFISYIVHVIRRKWPPKMLCPEPC